MQATKIYEGGPHAREPGESPEPAWIELFDQYGLPTVVLCSGVSPTGDFPADPTEPTLVHGSYMALENNRDGVGVLIAHSESGTRVRGIRIVSPTDGRWIEIYASSEEPPTVRKSE